MTPCKSYTEEFISRFVDNEVSCLDHDAFVRHMSSCRACAETEGRFRDYTRTFAGHVASQTLNILPISLEKETKRGSRLTDRILKPVALGTAALIFALVLFPWTHDPIREPSAIVNSVDTYGSSVMIIETLETLHTIIWFSET